MNEMNSESSKKSADTRNSWHCFMFKSKCGYNVFRKQSTVDICEKSFRELEVFGFKFGAIGFGLNHVHLQVDIPKKYSVLVAEIMLKSRSARKIFEEKPRFRLRYPRGSFWSGYEHHQAVGVDKEANTKYVEDQERHHGVERINDVQTRLSSFS